MAATVLAPFNPTSDEAIEAALDMAHIGPGDVVYDIGCGDGRLLVAAARLGATCVGVEYDPIYAGRAEARAAEAGVSSMVSIICGDATVVTDLAGATVVFVYLVPTGLRLMLPRLLSALAAGACIVSNIFSLPGVAPAEKRLAKGVPVYLYLSTMAKADDAAPPPASPDG